MNRSIGTAPGRIDVLGGVADYSGSLVLETPTTSRTTTTIERVPGNSLFFQWQAAHGFMETRLPAELLDSVPREDFEGFASKLDEYQVLKPVRYMAGCLFAAGARAEEGLRVSVTSEVPESMGVSSSAALEVATLRALQQLGDGPEDDLAMARLGQAVENRIVRAPCGIMDQIASVFGKSGALLPIRCRPDEVLEPVQLPNGVVAVGWPSGVQHDVGGSPYGMARAASFMGKRMLETVTGMKWPYTAEIPREVLESNLLPEQMSGEAFLQAFGQVDDPLSVILPEQTYSIRAATTFPILENARAEAVMQILRENGPIAQVGQHLFASHSGYSRMGLGDSTTDRMVEAIRAEGLNEGFYGARISGGGCGGTVTVLLDERAIPRLRTLAARLGVPAMFVR